MRRGEWLARFGLFLGLGLSLASSISVERCLACRLPAAGAQGIEVTESRASYSFAQQVTFSLRATSGTAISQVYLFFRDTGDEQAESVTIPIEPATEVSVDHVHELRSCPFTPFSTVTYWWQIEDTTGNTVPTEPQQFEYTDNRFVWEHRTSGVVKVHWTEGHGDAPFGQMALDIAQASLEDINQELRAPLPTSIDIYIYATQGDLNAAMMLAGREWAAGQAHPDLGVVVVAISPDDLEHESEMKRVVPHEMTHLLLYSRAGSAGYGYVPDWLDEGLATVNERSPDPAQAVMLEEAAESGQLLSLRSLCVPFSPDPDAASLSYAQSGAVVAYVRETYGADGIRALLEAYADGASCASGVQEALGLSLEGLEAAWLNSLTGGPSGLGGLGRIGIWIGLWLMSLLVAVPMLGGLRRSR